MITNEFLYNIEPQIFEYDPYSIVRIIQNYTKDLEENSEYEVHQITRLVVHEVTRTVFNQPKLAGFQELMNEYLESFVVTSPGLQEVLSSIKKHISNYSV